MQISQRIGGGANPGPQPDGDRAVARHRRLGPSTFGGKQNQSVGRASWRKKVLSNGGLTPRVTASSEESGALISFLIAHRLWMALVAAPSQMRTLCALRWSRGLGDYKRRM